jgi:hypothetical protein
MNQEDFLRLIEILTKAGWDPLICDTEIPIQDNPVYAGNPKETGNDHVEYIKFPKALLSWMPEIMVKVQGDSMVDAEVNDGDYVKLQYDQTPRSGDIVVVVIGKKVTLKVYYEDEDGNHWLVPQNQERRDVYKPILLDGRDEEVIVCGVVSEVLRQLPRVSTRSVMNELKAAKKAMEISKEISEAGITATIRTLAPKIKIARMWYAVFRKMVDRLIYEEDDYEAFCDRVTLEVPQHKHLPDPVEMQRMAVGSFAKPVRKWNVDNAPVSGSRFSAYKRLAEETDAVLMTGEGLD